MQKNNRHGTYIYVNIEAHHGAIAGGSMGTYPPLRVHLRLTDGLECDGTLYQKNQYIESEMCYNIWIKLDTNLGVGDMMVKDPRVLSIEVV
jgi:hypothetical protein